MSSLLASMSRRINRKERAHLKHKNGFGPMEHSDRIGVSDKFRIGRRPYVSCNNGQVRRVFRGESGAFWFFNCGTGHKVN